MLLRYVSSGLAVLAAVLAGLGIVFWIAANWQSVPRALRFVLRLPLALLGFVACGSLFVCFGQTYQTGADPWQLFALWAAPTLPLCLGVRHDVLWVAWAIVALTATQLFSAVQTIGWWWSQELTVQSSLGSWLPALVLAVLFRFAPRAWFGAGAGPWPMRLAMIYAIVGLATMSVRSLFAVADTGFYPISLLIVAMLAVTFSRRGLFDIFVLSVLGLAINVLLVCGMTQLLIGVRAFEIGALLLLAIASAALLAGTVKLLVHLARVQTGEHIL